MKNMFPKLQKSLYAPGQVMVIALILLAGVLILSASQFDRVGNFINFGSRSNQNELAINVAEAGIDKAIYELNDSAGAFTGETDILVGTTGTYTTTVTDISGSIKEITSTAYVPNSSNPQSKRTVKVEVYVGNEEIAFNYAVQIGEGGIEMDNNSTIIGNVYTNKTGISITGGNGSTITGDAFAVGTIGTPPTVTGTRNESQPPSQMPTLDYQFWRDAAVTGGTQTCIVTCTLTGTGNLGPKKYEGNLELDIGAVYTMLGPVHVTGNLILRNNSKINLDESFGSSGTVLLSDGKVFIDNNAQINPTTATPKGYILVASTSTADTNQVNCGDPGPTSNAICIDNNGVNAVFYSLEGSTTLDNNAGVTTLVAYGVFLDNNASFTYEQGLSSAQFTTGPGGAWVLRKGTYKIVKSP